MTTPRRRKNPATRFEVALEKVKGHTPIRLGESPAACLARMAWERGALISTLRMVCEEFGDNDWPDDMCPSEIIFGHLYKHLKKKRRR